MATPHRSRYSRPLKATLPYANSTGCSTTKGMPTSGTAAGSPTGGSRRGSGERRTSPERKSPVTAVTGKGQHTPTTDGCTGNVTTVFCCCCLRVNRIDDEANAKGSFNDPDCYMNSLWPRVPSSQVCMWSVLNERLCFLFLRFAHKYVYVCRCVCVCVVCVCAW